MWWNFLSAQIEPEIVSELPLGAAVVNAVILLTVIYGLYLWTVWLLAVVRKTPGQTPVCFQKQKTHNQRVAIPAPPVLLAGCWIAFNLYMALYPAADKEMTEIHVSSLTQMLAIQCVMGVGLIALWEFSGKQYHVADYFTPENWKEDLQAGGEIFLFALPGTILLGIVSLLWRRQEEMHPLLLMLQQEQDPQVLILIVLTAAIVAPLFEELLFRVLLLNGLQDQGKLPRQTAVLLVAVIFCLVHGWKDALQLLPLSLCLTWSLARRQSYLTVVTGHAIFNGFMLVMTLLNTQSV